MTIEIKKIKCPLLKNYVGKDVFIKFDADKNPKEVMCLLYDEKEKLCKYHMSEKRPCIYKSWKKL